MAKKITKVEQIDEMKLNAFKKIEELDAKREKLMEDEFNSKGKMFWVAFRNIFDRTLTKEEVKELIKVLKTDTNQRFWVTKLEKIDNDKAEKRNKNKTVNNTDIHQDGNLL